MDKWKEWLRARDIKVGDRVEVSGIIGTLVERQADVAVIRTLSGALLEVVINKIQKA